MIRALSRKLAPLLAGRAPQLTGATLGSLLIRVADASFYLAISVLLARYLGPDGYGVYALALATVSLLALPVQSGLPTLLIREVARYDLAGRWDLLRGIVRRGDQLTAVLAALIGLGTVASVWIAVDILFESRATFLWAVVLLPLISVGNLRGAVLRGLRHVVRGQLPEFVVRPGLFVVLLLVTVTVGKALTPQLAMALHAGAASVAMVFSIWLLRRSMSRRLRRAGPQYETRIWLRSLVPLTLLSGIAVINGQTDIILLGLLTSSADVGVYRVALSVSTAVVFALGAVNMVIAPLISRTYADKDQAGLQRLVTWAARVSVLLAAPAAMFLLLAGGRVLGFVFGTAFASGGVALGILALGQLCNAAAGSVALILNMTGHERDTIVGVGIAAVANLVLNVVLIPMFGMNGAASASAASIIIWNVILIRRVRHRVGVASVAWYRPGSDSAAMKP